MQTTEGNRQAAFYPTTDMRGKWHAAELVTDTAVCGISALLDTNAAPITPTVGLTQGSVHPIVCRSCLRLATSVGYSPRARA